MNSQLLKKAIKHLKKEFPIRCKIKQFTPSCLSCRTNITIGYLQELVDLEEWGKKYHKDIKKVC